MIDAGSKYVKNEFILAISGTECGTLIVAGSNAIIYWAENKPGSYTL